MSKKGDFIPNKLSFKVNDCMDRINKIIDHNLDILSDHLQQIVIHEIWNNGNGSRVMRLDAAANVKETRRTFMRDRVYLAVGIDPKVLKSKSEDLFVRVSVVLHGNSGDGKLMTKPGKDTWKKNVTNKGPSTAKSVWALPDSFSQSDVMVDIVRGVSENAEQNIKKYINEFVQNVSAAIARTYFDVFIKVER